LRNVVIASAVRTAGGSFGGSLASKTAVDLGAIAIKEAVKRANIDPAEVGQVIFGNGWQAGVGPNPARLCTVKGGLPVTCPAFTVNLRCASSLRAIELGVLSISAGEEDIIVAGGTESSSHVPYILPDARWGQRMGDKTVYDALHLDGFMCQLAGMMMGNTAEILAEKYKISREEQDSFSLNSHQKAVKAIDAGAFKEEIVPVEVKVGKEIITFDTDEIPRRETNMAKLSKLTLVFKKDGGTVTAGNSCALCDAAAAVVLIAEDKAKSLGLKPLAAIKSYSYVALEPKEMGLGPAKAIPAALKKAGMTLADIDLIELNEAFAAQVIADDRELKMDPDKLNVNGGAIALGHPVGATGAKILTTLLYALKNQDKNLGIVSLCIGGGQGVAMIVERLN
jgi:acetyl-CoA C-acetyltransferase